MVYSCPETRQINLVKNKLCSCWHLDFVKDSAGQKELVGEELFVELNFFPCKRRRENRGVEFLVENKTKT